MVKRVLIHIGNTIYNERLRKYRHLTWGDPRPIPDYLDLLEHSCDSSGYHKSLRYFPPYPRWREAEISFEPMLQLLMTKFSDVISMTIYEMAFGEFGEVAHPTWGCSHPDWSSDCLCPTVFWWAVYSRNDSRALSCFLFHHEDQKYISHHKGFCGGATKNTHYISNTYILDHA